MFFCGSKVIWKPESFKISRQIKNCFNQDKFFCHWKISSNQSVSRLDDFFAIEILELLQFGELVAIKKSRQTEVCLRNSQIVAIWRIFSNRKISSNESFLNLVQFEYLELGPPTHLLHNADSDPDESSEQTKAQET